MAKRPCAEPGCPALTDSTRCPQHTRERDRARGSRQQRGYDAAHDAERARWQRVMDAGRTVWCTRCGATIVNGTPWHLDHTDDRTGYLGPSHASCNTSAGGRAAHG